jgi:hypothetical protein
MQGTTIDGSDSTQWLERNSSVVNAFRMAKGDMDGDVKTVGSETIITHASVRDVSVLASLIDRGFLEEHHRSYAYTLLMLKDSFSGRLTYKLNGVFMEGVFGDPLSNTRAARMYDDITRDINLKRIRIIEAACNEPAATDAACKTIAGINAYRQCFEMLVRAVDDARRKLRAEHENMLAQDERFR